MNVRRLPFLDVFKDVSGGNIKTLQREFLDEGEIPIVDQGQRLVAGFVNDRSRVCKAKPPVLVFGDHTKIIKYVDFEFAMGADGTKVLVPKVESDTKYLYYALNAVEIPEAGYSRHYKFLKETQIPLPPLGEQKRIAGILDAADALRAKRREALAQLDTLTKSIFFDMFGDPATNLKGWPVVTIADICEVKGGKRLPKGEQYSPTPTSHRYIRVVDLKDGHVDEQKLVFLRPEIQTQIANYVVNFGDIIISIAGSIGLVAPVPATLDGVNLTENAAKLVPRRRKEFDAVFLAAYLQTPYAQSQIRSQVGQVTIGKLALFRIKKIKVPLPKLSLQRKFVLHISTLRKHYTVLRRAQLELDNLFVSLQQRAFRGEL